MLVEAGDEELGANVARHLSARGAAVVVAGADEKKLGIVVGEIAASGGKARHHVGDLAGAREKAIASFGLATFAITRAAQIAAEGENAIALDLIRAW